LLVAGKKEYYILIPNDSLRHIGKGEARPTNPVKGYLQQSKNWSSKSTNGILNEILKSACSNPKLMIC